VADENSANNFVGHGPMKIRDLFSSAFEADENTAKYFRRPQWPTKIVPYFHRLTWPTKIPIFSSVADENKPIFVEFILSAYFRRGADENSYFRWHLAYFRRLMADENILFSCSVPT
jgi:hypothetical protein